MKAKLGIAPIAWSNDDLPELGGETTLQTCLTESKLSGFSGVETGGKFPKISSELGPILREHKLHLASGWYCGTVLDNDLEKEKEILDEIEKATAAFLAKNKDSDVMKKLKAFSSEKRKEFEKSQKKHEKKEKRQNTEKFKKLLNEKKTTNELNYFYGLPLEKQKSLIKSMEDLNKAQKITIPYRFKLLEMDLPDSIKGLAMRKVNVLRTMDASSGEYNKIKNWMDAFMSI